MVRRGWASGRRRSERGFTLIEVILSVAILGIIGGVVATAYSVGLSILKPGGPQSRLLAAHNLMVMEQTLGKDGARASCVQLPGGTKYGACSKNFPLVSCPSTSLCFGWPQVSDSTCHVVVYTTGSSITATRSETVAGGSSSSSTLTRESPVTVSVDVANAQTAKPAGETYLWLRALPITITATGVSNPPSQKMVIHPVATDPAGTASQITSSGSPC